MNGHLQLLMLKLIFWAAYSVPDLFNCKHKLFISTSPGKCKSTFNIRWSQPWISRISSCNENFWITFTNFILLNGPGTECVTLTTKCFASAVAQGDVLSV